MIRKALFLTLAMVIATSSFAVAQVRTGTITGTITDEQGAVMPGVTVVLAGEQAQQTAVALENGVYNFRGLEPGTYNLSFELSGFATLNREEIIVSSGQTVPINAIMQVASVAETITVTGESPVVDVKTTAIASTFNETELYDVPSATDAWAVLGRTPGIRMRGYDVGGSHKSQQVNYESFGMRNQNQIISDGVNTTEGFGWTAVYFDYYAIEEYKISAAGADVEMMSPGAAVVMTVKSGGNDPSSLFHLDYENESFVSNNIDQETLDRGFTGNPNLLFWELHGDYGGPIVKDKAWIYLSYNHFTIKKAVSGVDQNIATDDGIFNNYTAKATWQITEKDKLVGYSNWMRKEKPNRGLSAARPPDNILGQDYYTWVHKAEWQRIWNDRLFTDLMVNHFGSVWPMTPISQSPPRFDTVTTLQSGAGWLPFTNTRWKPHVNLVANYYVPDAAGTHDFKIGYHWQIDSEAAGDNGNSGPVRYRDARGLTNQIRLTSVPVDPSSPDTRNRRNEFFIQDTWSPNNNLTVALGVRYTHQRAYFLDNEVNPLILQEFPFIAGMEFEGQSFEVKTVSGDAPGFPATHGKIAPRLGVTYDLTGQGRSVLKASYGRYNANISQAYSGVHPASTLEVITEFNDLNGDRVLSGAEEIGDTIDVSGGGGLSLNANDPLPYSDEVQLSFDQQLGADSAIRATYVHKIYRNAGPDRYRATNLQQAPFLTVPFQFPDPRGGQPLNLLTTPIDQFGSNNVLTTYLNGADSWDYDTIVLSYEKRFTNNFMYDVSFDYQWRDEPKGAQSISTSPLTSDPPEIRWFQDHHADVDGNNQSTTNWGFKGMARYVVGPEIGLATNIRVNSGFNFSRVVRTPIYAGTGLPGPNAGPSLGTKGFWVEDLKNNRSDTVPIVDFRVDKSFSVGGYGRATVMLDIYNAFNSNPVFNFFYTTPNFGNIIAALDPRTIKIGIRWTY